MENFSFIVEVFQFCVILH